jgi:hypothetical protein
MKLWHVAQWGNKEDGGDGHDTQCVIRSNEMISAIEKAELHMSCFDWKEGKADVVYLLGEDESVGDKTELVIAVWFNPAFNLAHHPAWFKDHNTNQWVDEKTMYGDE